MHFIEETPTKKKCDTKYNLYVKGIWIFDIFSLVLVI